MPQEGSADDWGSLRIRALRGGSVAEVSMFLADLENAYNALYWLDEALVAPRRRLFFLEGYLLGRPFYSHGLTAEQILPERRLRLDRVVIQSLGFWEVLGSLNPLQQIREYLKDRHERNKDKRYREDEEHKKLKLDNDVLQQSVWHGELDLFRKHLGILREFGGDQKMIEQALWSQLGPPMSRLGRHQDTGLIEGPEPDDNGDPA